MIFSSYIVQDIKIAHSVAVEYDLPFKKLKSASTLSETLIALTIIGVIAALTIPAVGQKFKEKMTISKLKKGYATLSVALENARLDKIQLIDSDNKWYYSALGISSECDGTSIANIMQNYIQGNVNSSIAGKNCCGGEIRTEDGIIYGFHSPNELYIIPDTKTKYKMQDSETTTYPIFSFEHKRGKLFPSSYKEEVNCPSSSQSNGFCTAKALETEKLIYIAAKKDETDDSDENTNTDDSNYGNDCWSGYGSCYEDTNTDDTNENTNTDDSNYGNECWSGYCGQD